MNKKVLMIMMLCASVLALKGHTMDSKSSNKYLENNESKHNHDNEKIKRLKKDIDNFNYLTSNLLKQVDERKQIIDEKEQTIRQLENEDADLFLKIEKMNEFKTKLNEESIKLNNEINMWNKKNLENSVIEYRQVLDTDIAFANNIMAGTLKDMLGIKNTTKELTELSPEALHELIQKAIAKKAEEEHKDTVE